MDGTNNRSNAGDSELTFWQHVQLIFVWLAVVAMIGVGFTLAFQLR